MNNIHDMSWVQEEIIRKLNIFNLQGHITLMIAEASVF